VVGVKRSNDGNFAGEEEKEKGLRGWYSIQN